MEELIIILVVVLVVLGLIITGLVIAFFVFIFKRLIDGIKEMEGGRRSWKN